ncbi:hypothetical protein PE074_01145 [Wohlfahrtiimonas chitiniclastica]|uniref:Membrane protein YkvI n=1 Tax=Wohlfahrtiimonas chitiniclastica SH04 TaxID=1261130 RepID=L8XW13_9GAMM|nr:hypothetical protein [Wohlfahrtiimonas chitiniclastica]ELV08243.1 Hypothetical protein F387_00486 [Wohlfahrtiimonas chitiniclastica SH04]KZS23170.1 hypothetical protein BMY_1014 [Wohlfahrtiimonas chitiniclastica]MBS7814302.1 hypothetical protein [Wohlfahrtiimonas chitiniclastica]MBS7828305.1 hypothetical protein [Wohlfahrtiimonas chitiniclastica]MBS7835987.1 hypothetical protein [Wohlfahrtiimonas chitiniclastica]
MFKIIQMAFAFVGVIVGAGFASGQEILQYFTSFGTWGTFGAAVSTGLFAYLGMMLMKMGSRLQTASHDEAIYKLSGKFLGTAVDYIIIFTLFGVGVVMVAGAGSMLNQQYDVPAWLGSLLMTIMVVATVLLPINRVIALIGAITPFLIIALAIICVYSLFTHHATIEELEPVATSVKSSLPNWFIAAINYVSFNVAVGAGMALVMGGSEKNEKIATWGGLIGGLLIGALIVVAHYAIFLNIHDVKDVGLPLLKIIQDLSPTLGIMMTIVLFGMIYNTGVAMYYAFVARFTTMQTKRSYMFAGATGLVGFVASFAGFTGLVAYFYPLIGYLGLLLIAILVIAPFKIKKEKATEYPHCNVADAPIA